jgi:predicted TIM-barrel fold metal-dependent hydrolase
MLRRRTALTTAGVFGCLMAASSFLRVPGAGPKPKTPIAFEVPRGACDAHVHVIGEPREFPLSVDRDYTPPAATAEELREVLQFLNFDRVVIVTPDVYGTDNSATLSAIRQLGQDRARGVGWIAETTPSGVLDSMRTAGIVGIRLSLDQGGVFNAETAAKRLREKIDLAEKHGWHLEIGTPPDVIAALVTQLASCPIPVVMNTFGWVEGGVEQAGFDAVVSLVKSGKAYVKLSEPYRLSKKAPNYPDLLPVVQALVAANPDRMLWGSGWPFVSGAVPGRAKLDLTPHLPLDAGHLLDLFAAWVPDAETRRKILVANPARLYGF